MQSAPRTTPRQAAIFISVAVGIVVAVVTTATFWWIYSLTLGPEQEAARIADASLWSYSAATTDLINATPNTPPDGRPAWLGEQAWIEGVQAGQAYVERFPNPVNVQVLVGMNTSQIWQYMTQYVSPALGVGCQYCHNINNFASEEYPQKASARAMLRLVNDVNSEFIVNLPNWQGNYVQCATCHNGQAVGMEAFGDQFAKSVPPINVVVDPLDAQGRPILDPAQKPEPVRDPLLLKEAILYYVSNYQVWKPYDPADPESGRGSLALTYETGRTQDQVTVNQNVMNYMSWSLGVGCTYCHNSRNFVAYETDPAGNLANPVYAYNKLKAQRMLQLTTWLQANWLNYGANGYAAIPDHGASELTYRTLQGQVYNVPGCYTCHQGNAIPKAAINQSAIPAGDAGISTLPTQLRGGK
jgi:photosynthetic reaction center cytochrome c subunit